MYDAATDATVGTHQIRFRRVKAFAERQPLGNGERAPEAHERIQAIMEDAFDGSGQPARIVTFVAGPFKVIAVEDEEMFVE